MTPDGRREADRIIFQMLGEHNQALKNLDKTLEKIYDAQNAFAEYCKQCAIGDVKHEQEKMRSSLRFFQRVCVVVGSLFGSAIFFLLVGHYFILMDWFKFVFK